jgi:hypothetical protein
MLSGGGKGSRHQFPKNTVTLENLTAKIFTSPAVFHAKNNKINVYLFATPKTEYNTTRKFEYKILFLTMSSSLSSVFAIFL